MRRESHRVARDKRWHEVCIVNCIVVARMIVLVCHCASSFGGMTMVRDWVQRRRRLWLGMNVCLPYVGNADLTYMRMPSCRSTTRGAAAGLALISRGLVQTHIVACRATNDQSMTNRRLIDHRARPDGCVRQECLCLFPSQCSPSNCFFSTQPN